MKIYIFPILRYVRAKITVVVIKLDQLVNCYPRKMTNCKNLCTKPMENCYILAPQIQAELLSRDGDIGIQTNFAKL